MPGFTTRADIIAEYDAGKILTYDFAKINANAPEAAGVWTTCWTNAGRPAAGATPATTPGTLYTADDTPVAGAIGFGDRSTDQKFLYKLGASANQNGTLMLYDRLCAVSAISVVGTGAKTVNSSAVADRYNGTAADKNEVWLEVTTVTNTNSVIINISSYTSSDGSTTLSGGNVTFPAAATNVDTFIQMPMDASDKGVRSVESLNVTTAAASTGTVNVVILRPIVKIPIIGGLYNEVNFLDEILSLPRIFDNATLGLAFQASGTTAATVAGTLQCVYG